MKNIMNFCKLVTVVALCGLDLSVDAAESLELSVMEKQGAELTYRSTEKTLEVNKTKVRAPITSIKSSVLHSEFYFHDAWIDLIADYDNDGFYSEFSVIFDADNDFGTALVYAEIYISENGGPFFHIHSTRDFYIHGDSKTDDFEVFNTLLNAFPAGYYEIAIDLFEVGFDDVVATIDGEFNNDLFAIPLEQVSFDEPPTEVIIVETTEHGGALFYLLALLPLLLSFRSNGRLPKKTH